MTEEEARKIVEIMLTVDNGCDHCAGNLIDQFVESFPEHAKLAKTLLGSE